MDSRLEHIDTITRAMLIEIARTSGVEISMERHPDNPMVRSVPPLQIRLFDVGLYAEAEMLKANTAGAYFASCLAGATMNEALLSLMCLMFREEVEQAEQFRRSKAEKRFRNKSFEGVVSRWEFQHLINLAKELIWIPTSVVSEDIKKAFADGYRELIPQTHPRMKADEVEATAQSFYGDDAGSAILAFTQDIRNLIHAGRWLRIDTGFNPDTFSRWCEFGVYVFSEVRVCLMHSLASKNKARFEKKQRNTDPKVAALPPELRAEYRRQLSEKMTWSKPS